MATAGPEACPCLDAHRRLMDLHEDIHRAIENYFDENEFRRWLNSAIQNSRAVTFLLQKRKAKWSDFDDWYGEWQERARSNPVLSWGVTARNRIVKEEDLQTLSQAIVSIYDTHALGYEDVFSVPPSAPPEAMIEAFIRVMARDGKPRKGWIRVVRRWTDDQLPDYELTGALREMYSAVAEVVELAHRAGGVDRCTAPPFSRSCVDASIDPELHCLGSNRVLPSMMLDVETGEVVTIQMISAQRDDEIGRIGVERYGMPPSFSTDPIVHVDERVALSRTFIEKDGYAGPMLVLFGPGGSRMFPISFVDHEPREAKIAAVVESVGAWQFTGAVFSSETWLGRTGSRGRLLNVSPSTLLASNTEFFSADRRRDREEALMVVGMSGDGRSRSVVIPFGRVLGGYRFGEPIISESGGMIPIFLRPIWKHWPASAVNE
jgi:hypothetical protein